MNYFVFVEIYPVKYQKYIRLYIRNISGYVLEIYRVTYQKYIRLCIRNISGYILEIYLVTYQKYILLHIRNISGYVLEIYPVTYQKFIYLLILTVILLKVGIVAWGIGCGDAIPGVYTSVEHIGCWIDYTLKCKLGDNYQLR